MVYKPGTPEPAPWFFSIVDMLPSSFPFSLDTTLNSDKNVALLRHCRKRRHRHPLCTCKDRSHSSAAHKLGVKYERGAAIVINGGLVTSQCEMEGTWALVGLTVKSVPTGSWFFSS